MTSAGQSYTSAFHSAGVRRPPSARSCASRFRDGVACCSVASLGGSRDVSAEESSDLIRTFQSYVTRPENTVRWRYRPGDVVIWDNQSTQHYAIDDYGDAPRRLQRVTLIGRTCVCRLMGRTSETLAGDPGGVPVASADRLPRLFVEPHRHTPSRTITHFGGRTSYWTCDQMVTYRRHHGYRRRVGSVFKALADPTRRFLLDLLFARDGRTLTELESELAMTRFGVMKHLKVLEEASLVVTANRAGRSCTSSTRCRSGSIHDRWIDKYTERKVTALLDLKDPLEKTIMTAHRPHPTHDRRTATSRSRGLHQVLGRSHLAGHHRPGVDEPYGYGGY